MSKLLKIFLVFLLTISYIYLHSQECGFFRKQVVLDPMNTQYYIFRIPSIVTTQKGTIMIFAEGRKGRGGDWDPSNIVFRASYDKGNTWTDISILGDYGITTCSNAVPIFDYFENKLHVVYTVGYSIVYYTCSSDDGLSWEKPVNITASFEKIKAEYPWKVIATGPGHGTQLSSGRIIVPVWMSSSGAVDSATNTLAHHPSISTVLFSDDFGKTWETGDIISPNNDTLIFPNEAICVETADGFVMFNMRNESPNYRRLVSISPNGVSNWTRPYYSDNFFEPICHASMIRYSIRPFQDQNRILFVNPDSRMSPWSMKRGTTSKAAPKRERSNLTLRISYDEAVTFPVSKVIDPGIAGYSDLAIDSTGVIHCIYESGMKNNNKFLPSAITMVSFDLQWATNCKDSLSVNDMPINSNMICAADKQNNPQPIKKKKYNRFRKKAPRTC
ncbi:MAG: sialidase family protein [Lentimicrobiaceae bacterium]|nr:sialidase family protein [Lentimicrobiaceae bacterium]